MKDVSSERRDYTLKSLSRNDLIADPIKQFEKWFEEAEQDNVFDFNAMVLSTVKSNGMPSSRVVLLKSVDPRGFTFFTNYESNKGKQLQENSKASLLFYWAKLERQVRIEGEVRMMEPSESDAYYLTRPAGSRLGAWASPQSKKVPTRKFLEKQFKDYSERLGNDPQQRPEHWGGYIVKPISIEFWQGRENRLHDRLVYELVDTEWEISRLAP